MPLLVLLNYRNIIPLSPTEQLTIPLESRQSSVLQNFKAILLSFFWKEAPPGIFFETPVPLSSQPLPEKGMVVVDP